MSPSYVINGLFVLTLLFQTTAPVFAEASTSLKSYYSPIVRLEPDKGFFLITTDSGIQWIKVAEPGKTHLKTLAVGDMIDIVVELRENAEPQENDQKLPPLLKSWKLARSDSPCKVFDGKSCKKE
jgi:hypothetical protein